VKFKTAHQVRRLRWPAVVLLLVLVGACPALLAPVCLLLSGVAAVAGLVPLWAWLAAAVVWWLSRRKPLVTARPKSKSAPRTVRGEYRVKENV
jgi:hypothetical protein